MNNYFSGSKFQFAVPDAFNHENEVRNFMLIADNANKTLSICYANNECSCKDGWLKWENIPISGQGLSVSTDGLLYFLENYYTNKDGSCALDKGTFKWL